MSGNEKIMLVDFVEQVKNGTLDIDTLPQGWREKVQQVLDSEGA